MASDVTETTFDQEVIETVRSYCEPFRDAEVDTLILGCTHYPLLSGLISVVMGPDVVLISSAEETAKDVYVTLRSSSLQRGGGPEPRHEFLTTGDPAQFRSVAQHFLGPDLGGVHPVEVRAVEGVSWS